MIPIHYKWGPQGGIVTSILPSRRASARTSSVVGASVTATLPYPALSPSRRRLDPKYPLVKHRAGRCPRLRHSASKNTRLRRQCPSLGTQSQHSEYQRLRATIVGVSVLVYGKQQTHSSSPQDGLAHSNEFLILILILAPPCART